MYFEAQVENELRPIQSCTISKEMEMNFRTVVVALAVLAMFAGLASAQVITPSPINCTVSATPSTVRAEASNDRVGDLVITCSGGNTPVLGSTSGVQVDKGTLVLDFGVNVASRVDTGLAANASEAVALIDEPGSVTVAPVTPGFGPNAAVSLCEASAAKIAAGVGCTTFGQTVSGYWVLSATAVQPPVANAPNAYQGVNGTGANSTKVSFFNLPVLAPVASNVTRVIRVSNVRIAAVAAGSAVTVTATFTPNTGSSNTLNLTNSTAVVANSVAGLVPSIQTIGGASLCASTNLNPLNSSVAKANLAILSFTEGFANALKTRVVPSAAVAAAAWTPVAGAQMSVSGSTTIGGSAISYYSSESGFITPTFAGGAITPGQADSGTRIKAVFAGLDPKATYYVSYYNVIDFNTEANAPTAEGDQGFVPYARLVGLNTAGALNASEALAAGTFLAVGAARANGAVAPAPRVVALVPTAANAAEAVWEIQNATPGAIDTFRFAVYAEYSNATGNAPTIANTAKVTIGFAPTAGTVAPFTTWVPRYAAPAAAGANVNSDLFKVVKCQTSLLFPYITSVQGYVTGLSIANTSADPFSTVQSSGGCSLYLYGQNQPAAALAIPTISAGTIWANSTVGLSLVNFNGYGIAVCDFQYAHGFAFVQNGTSTVGMGYVPLVMVGGTGGNGRGQALVGETLTQ